MAIESADIASLLRRARDTTAPLPVKEPEQVPPAAVQGLESDLLDIHAELRADEVLMERILGLLYREKKKNPNGGAVSILELERQLGLEREGPSFVIGYMKSTKVVEMDDKSRVSITVPGIEYLRRSMGVDKTGGHA